jgi:hypothetical protein
LDRIHDSSFLRFYHRPNQHSSASGSSPCRHLFLRLRQFDIQPEIKTRDGRGFDRSRPTAPSSTSTAASTPTTSATALAPAADATRTPPLRHGWTFYLRRGGLEADADAAFQALTDCLFKVGEWDSQLIAEASPPDSHTKASLISLVSGNF